MTKIAAVLNAYKRPEALLEQFDAVNSQTISPSEIHVWQNGRFFELPQEIQQGSIVAVCNENLGVWARFAYALNVEADYICIFDDDTIPGSRWFENCLATMETHEGLLGTRGLRFKSSKSYRWYDEFGWNSPNETAEAVDIVGHAWFFKREWLAAYWSELNIAMSSPLAGEDMHFSYAIQKHLGLQTFVPPHPVDQLDLWGSQPKSALALGGSAEAISNSSEATTRFQKIFRQYVNHGFQLVAENPRSLTGSERRKDLLEQFRIGAAYRQLKKKLAK